MEVSKLETLSEQLHRLRDQLNAASLSRDAPLEERHALVRAARECEFMLPHHLTVGTLADTVDLKIENVRVLLERARNHENLPDAAQAAAEQGYGVTEEDVENKVEQGPRDSSARR